MTIEKKSLIILLGGYEMGIFGKKYVKPTATEKKEIDAILSRMATCCKRLETVDSIDKYFTEWDKYVVDQKRLAYFEGKGIKFTASPKKIHDQICKEIPRVEIDVIDRGFDRMQRDAAKLSTNKGKQKKSDAFFNELEYYYSRLQPSSVEHIKELKLKANYVADEPGILNNNISMDRLASRFCSKCGATIGADDMFCSKCGNKLQ